MGKRVLQMPRQQPKTTTITHQRPLTCRDTERAAQQDLHTVLRLVDKGRIAVSEKNRSSFRAAVAESPHCSATGTSTS